MRRFLARFVLAVSGYRIVGTPPGDPVCVLVAAPHTSNWDFILMLAMAWKSGLSVVWLGKKEMFWGPLTPYTADSVGPRFHPTDDVVADMDVVREFYRDKHGVKPDRFTPPLLREEDPDPAARGSTLTG